MYTTALLMFMAIAGFPSFVEDIKVGFTFHKKWLFIKDILKKYYPTH
jgi:hypothetical protein